MGDLVQHGLPCPDCESSDARAEYTNNYFCFSCEKSTLKRHRSRKQPEKNDGEVHPPVYERRGMHSTWTSELRDVIKKVGLTIGRAEKYGIHHTHDLNIWSKRLEKYVSMGPRLILPHPGGFEAKALGHDDRIKYVTYGTKDCLFVAKDWPHQVEKLYIVEDIFSAIRVGEFMPCVSLLGTNLTKQKEAQLRTMSKKFVIWLDSDPAGRKASEKLKTRLGWFADSVQCLRTENDPKCHSDDELEDILDE